MTSSGQAGDKHILERRSRAATAICGIGFGGLYLSLRLACIKQTLSGTTKVRVLLGGNEVSRGGKENL